MGQGGYIKPFVATATAAAPLLGASAFAATGGDDTTAVAAMAAPGGDAAAGEAAFAKRRVTCHVIVSPDGETIAGSRGRQGPNLYGIAGGPVASVEDFKDGKPMIAVGETDTMWPDENLVAYLQDPTDWLRAALDDNKIRIKMAWKVRDSDEAAYLYAYFHALALYEAE